jgi:hypothetical protein
MEDANENTILNAPDTYELMVCHHGTVNLLLPVLSVSGS